jgi:WD40 repeat protein/DNA-binding CsgD family transcriptional regulator
MDDLSHTTIRGYELQERIGGGGFGAVYRAYQPIVDREVAVKIILPRYANHPDFIRRFEFEAQLVARLEHPHIVPLYDYWRDAQGAYLIMRWLRGGSLADMLKKHGPLSLEDTALLLDQMAAALTVAHRNNVIHRDLKPANILLDQEGNGYLSDFGIAKDIGDRQPGITETDIILGSPDYISPEQAKNEAVTPQTDVYALGVMLYEMLAGEHPFPHASSMERIFKHINEPIPLLEKLPPGVRDDINEVIRIATAKKPTERYQSAVEFATTFRDAASIQPARGGMPLIEELTQREQEILAQVLDGRSNKEIAEAFVLEVGTIKWHLKNIYRKLDAKNRVQAMVRARDLNLIPGIEPRAELEEPTLITMRVMENPYKGLRAFQEADAADFFGRQALTDRLIARLAEDDPTARFLAVVGPSGSGKSSVVKAGLIPALRKGALPNSEKAFIVELYPGTHPLEELEAALLRVAVNPPASLIEQLREDERGLIRATKRILPADERTELIVIIDQFEEVFTLLENEGQRLHLLDSLLTAIDQPRSRLRVIITLRADFYDRPLLYENFGIVMRKRTEVVLPLSSAEIAEAVLRPAERVGAEFEAGLVAEIVNDVSEHPGALPLLQYALTELFERRKGRTLTFAAYQEIGRVTGALARRADEIYNDLGENEQEIARQLFLRLVSLGEGTEDTRRRVRRAELSDDSGRLDDIINAFGEARLLTFDRDPVTRGPTVEVAHEALIRQWTRVREWLNASREDLHLHRRLTDEVAEWIEADRAPGFLVTGARLDQYQTFAEGTDLMLNDDERAYLEASLAHRNMLRARDEALKAREFELQRRAAQRLRYLAIALVLFLIVAAGLSVFAFGQRNEAQDAAGHAETQAAVADTNLRQAWDMQALFLADLSQQRLQEGNLRLALRLAREGLAHYDDGIYNYENQQALIDVLAQPGLTRFYWPLGTGNVGAVWSPDETQVLAWSEQLDDGRIVVWDANTGEVTNARRYGRSVLGARWIDNAQILVWSSDGMVRIWNLDNDSIVFEVAQRGGFGPDVRWLPERRQLLVGSRAEHGNILLWDVDTQQVAWQLPFNTWVRAMEVDGSGSRLLLATADSLSMIDLDSGEVLFSRANLQITNAMWRPNNNQILAWGGGNAWLWDVETGELLLTLAHDSDVDGAAWSADGVHLLTWTKLSDVWVWDTGTGEARLRLEHLKMGGVGGARWSADAHRILSWANDYTAKVWSADTGQVLADLPHQASVTGARWNANESAVLTWSADGILRLWDLSASAESGELAPLVTIPHGAPVRDAQWNADETRVLSWTTDGFVYVHDLVPNLPVTTLSGDAVVSDPRFQLSESKTLDDTFTLEGDTVGVHDRAGKLMFTLQHDLDPLFVLTDDESEYSPTVSVGGALWNGDGTRILTWADDSTARIWDGETGELRARLWHGNSAVFWDNFEPDGTITGGSFAVPIPVKWAAWGPDGRLVSTAAQSDQGPNDVVHFWDGWTGEEYLKVDGANRILWNADGTQVLVWCEGRLECGSFTENERTVQLWDTVAWVLLQQRVYDAEVGGVSWSVDEDQFLTWTADRQVTISDVRTGKVLLTLPVDQPIEGAQWVAAENAIAVRLQDGGQVWPLDPAVYIARANSLATLPMTNEERARFFLPILEPTLTPSPLPTITPLPTLTFTPSPTPNATLSAQVSRQAFVSDDTLGIIAPDWPMPGHDAARTRHNTAETQLKPPLMSLWTRSISNMVPDDLTVAGNQIGLSGQWFFPGEGENAALALDANTGAELWHYALSEQAGGAMDVPLTFSRNSVFFGGQGDDYLYAVDRQSGKLVWRLPGFVSLYATNLAVVDDWLVVPGQYSGAMLAQTETGEPVWGGPGRGAGSAAVRHGLIYASSNQGQTIAAYEPASGAQAWAFTGIDEPVYWQWLVAGEDYLYFKTAPNEVAALAYDTQSVVWRTRPDMTALSSISPALADGKLVVLIPETPDERAMLVALDAQTGETLWTFEQNNRGLWDVAAANGVVYALGYARTLYAFDATSGEMLWQQALRGGRGGSGLAIADGVLYVLAGDMLYAFAAAPDDYQTPTPTPVVTATPGLDAQAQQQATATAEAARYATAIPQATALAAAHPATVELASSHTDPVRGATLSKDESRLVTWTDSGDVYAWDFATGELLFSLELDTIIGGANWNASETRIGIWSYSGRDCGDHCDMTAYVVNMDGASDTFGKVMFTYTQPFDPNGMPSGGVVWNPDETRILVWSNEIGAYVLDAETGRVLFELPHDKGLWGGIWTGDGTRVITWATTGFTGAARIWRIPDHGSITLVPEHTLQHGNVVWGAALNSDSTRVLTWSLDGTAAVWEVATGRALYVFRHDDMVWHGAWLDDTRVMTSSLDGIVRIWLIEALAPQETRVPQEAAVQFSAPVALSRSIVSLDGNWVLSDAARNQTVIWDAGTGEERFWLEGHSVDDPWHPNSRYALTIDRQSVTVWDVETGECVARLLGGAPMRGAQWTSNGRILTWGDDGYWRVWRVMLEN